MSDAGRIIPYSGDPPTVVVDYVEVKVHPTCARGFRLNQDVVVNGRSGKVDRIDLDAGEIRVVLDGPYRVLVAP
jgi:hypothetical protein